MFTKGITATECGGGLNAAGAPGDDVTLDVASTTGGFGAHALLISRYVSAPTTSSRTATKNPRFQDTDRLLIRGIAGASATEVAGDRAPAAGSSDSSFWMRVTNWSGVSPWGKR